jgi:hypothetical protein
VPSRSLAAVLAVVVVAVPNLARAAEPHINSTAPPPVTRPCTHSVPSDVDKVDASKEDFADVGPGSVVCLTAGRRGNLKLMNLHGSAGAPIIVRNHGGPVVIGGTEFEAGIKLMASTHVRITGAGVTARCGAAYSAAQQRCGIQIDGAIKGIKMATTKGLVGHIEIDHVAVLRVTEEKRTRGILIHPLPGEVVTGLYVHHSYVANTQAEAIYLGSEPHGQPFSTLAKLRGVEVSYNRVENIGWDGIKIKVAIADVFVHHNVIVNAGMSRTEAHQGGIKVATSVGHYFNNTVLGAVEGIRMGRPLPWPGTRYYNNLVVDVVDVGIDAPEAGARIYHNTVVGSQEVGISATGSGSTVAYNIVADAGVPLETREARVVDNLIGARSEVGFADPIAGDYRLTAISSAVDAVQVATSFSCHAEVSLYPKWTPAATGPRTDRDDRSRPAGCRIDLGAFEYGSSAMAASRRRS